MPIYEYRCESCGQTIERLQKLSAPPLTVCPSCEGSLTKLISAPSFQFKGSGWYVTDYADKGGKSAGEGQGESDSGESSSESSSGSSESSDSGSAAGDSKASPDKTPASSSPKPAAGSGSSGTSKAS